MESNLSSKLTVSITVLFIYKTFKYSSVFTSSKWKRNINFLTSPIRRVFINCLQIRLHIVIFPLLNKFIYLSQFTRSDTVSIEYILFLSHKTNEINSLVNREVFKSLTSSLPEGFVIILGTLRYIWINSCWHISLLFLENNYLDENRNIIILLNNIWTNISNITFFIV